MADWCSGMSASCTVGPIIIIIIIIIVIIIIVVVTIPLAYYDVYILFISNIFIYGTFWF